MTGVQTCALPISQPPILGGLLGVIGKIATRGKLMYQIMDFNPEQTIAVNYAGNKMVLGAMMWFDKLSCRFSDVVVTLGRDMQETLYKRFKSKNVPNNVVINNWIDETKVYPLEHSDERVAAFRKQYGLEGKFVIMTSGNIGLYYDFEKKNGIYFLKINGIKRMGFQGVLKGLFTVEFTEGEETYIVIHRYHPIQNLYASGYEAEIYEFMVKKLDCIPQ